VQPGVQETLPAFQPVQRAFHAVEPILVKAPVSIRVLEEPDASQLVYMALSETWFRAAKKLPVSTRALPEPQVSGALHFAVQRA
jgi:hypothetical protein